MKRLLALVIAVLLLSGCRCQSPSATDPFFGRSRVPPPGTGSISGGPADPYYRGVPYSPAPNWAAPAGPASQLPLGRGGQPAAPGGGRGFIPPGGSFNYQGSSTRGVRIPGSSRSGTRVPPPSFADRFRSGVPKETAGLSGRERVIQILQPRSKTAASGQHTWAPHSAVASMPREPRRLDVPSRAIDIVDLPRAGGSTSASGPQSASGASGFRLVSGSDQPEDSAVATAAGISTGATERTAAEESAPRSSYGYDPEYRWVRGKLEYSEIDRRWKLRYIPVERTGDEFGGSVVLPDPTMLAGCERGDFVEVRGQLGDRYPKKGYAPTYEVAEIKRLSRATP